MTSSYTTKLYTFKTNLKNDDFAKLILTSPLILRPKQDFLDAGLSEDDIVEVEVKIELNT